VTSGAAGEESGGKEKEERQGEVVEKLKESYLCGVKVIASMY
jgi:hypothetical protein